MLFANVCAGFIPVTVSVGNGVLGAFWLLFGALCIWEMRLMLEDVQLRLGAVRDEVNALRALVS